MSLIRNLWEKWKKIAHAIAVFQSRLILTIFYFVILLPFGIVFSFKKKASPAGWVSKENHQNSIEELREQ